MKNNKLITAIAVVVNLVLSACGVSVAVGEKNEEHFDTEGITAIHIYEDVQDVSIVSSKSDKIDVTYYESSAKKYSIVTRNGVLSICGTTDRSVINQNQSLIVSVPPTYAGALSVQVETGNCTISTDVTLTTVKVILETGNISIERLNSNDIYLSASTGNISGILTGDRSDYTISSRYGTGTSNLSDQIVDDSNKSLFVEVDTGAIDIMFTNEKKR